MGDTVSVRGVFSQEANKEANDLIMSNKNLLDGSGLPIRTIGKEALQTIFALTQD